MSEEFKSVSSHQTSGLPLQSGKVMVSTEHLTELERETLAQLPGWKPGEEVPSDLAEAIAQMKEEANQVQLPDPNMPKAKPGPVKDISELSPERQAELTSYIEEARKAQAAAAESAALPPDVQQAISGQNTETIEIENDLKPAAKETDNELGQSKLANCPHCNWDLSVADIGDLDEDDVSAYQDSLLGNTLFQRETLLFGGKAAVTVRELMHREVDAVFEAARKQLEKEEGLDDAVVLQARFADLVGRYRSALQIVRLQLGDKVYTFRERLATDAQHDGWASTCSPEGVYAAYNHVFEDVVSRESLARVLLHEVNKFGRILSKLEATAASPNF